MFGIFAEQKQARAVSGVERITLIAKLIASLGTHYSNLRQYRGL